MKLGLLNFIDPGNPACQLGIERFINPKNSLQWEGGLIPYDFNLSEEAIAANHKGYLFRVAYKYWLTPKLYAGPEIFKVNNDYIANQRFVSASGEDAEPYFDVIGISRKVNDMDLKVGYVKDFKRLFLDFSVGAGIAHKKVSHSNRQNPNDNFQKDANFTFQTC